MPNEANNGKSVGGDWLNRMQKHTKETRPVANAQAGSDAGASQTTASATTQAVAAGQQQVSSQKSTTEQVSMQEAGNGAVQQQQSKSRTEQTAAQTTTEQPKGKPQIAVEDEETLITLPGQKPKTAKQIIYEQKQGSDLERRKLTLDASQKKLDEGLAELKQLKASIETARQVPKQETVTQVADNAPVLPKDALPGDPEHTDYLIKLAAHNAAKDARKAVLEEVSPLLKKLEEREQQEEARRSLTETQRITLQNNRLVFSDALANDLPWDFDGLPEDVQSAVVERIHEVARDARLDLKNGGHLQDIAPEHMRLIFKAAFHEDSLPPGYRSKQQESVQEETNETLEEARRVLQQSANQPIAERTKPQPLHQTGTGAIATSNGKAAKPTGDWWDRLQKGKS